MQVKRAYDYDDVLIVPKASNINSRDDVNLYESPGGLYPILSSPMTGISGVKLVKEMARLNCLGILHRFMPIEDRYKAVRELIKDTNNFGVAIGIRDGNQELEFAEWLANDIEVDLIMVDVANGYTKYLNQFIQELYERTGHTGIVAGSVVDMYGARNLVDSRASFIRVGIGSGALCSTRNVTGIGYPQLSAIESVNSLRENFDYNFKIIADGGIKNSGNAVKAFAVGADFVMLGSLLASSLEAENDGTIYGMASRKMQELYYDQIKSDEGLEIKIDNFKKRPLEEIITEFLYGIKSACTYLNCSSYKQIKDNAEFVTAGNGSIKNL